MWRRWIIRSFFLGLLLMCVAVWVGSHAGRAEVSWMGDDLWVLESGDGQIGLEHWPSFREKYGWRDGEPTWKCSFATASGNAPPYILDDHDYRARRDFLGFMFLWDDPYQSGLCAGGIPFYFLTVISVLVLLLVWRTTRNPKIGGAFPVETAATREPA